MINGQNIPYKQWEDRVALLCAREGAEFDTQYAWGSHYNAGETPLQAVRSFIDHKGPPKHTQEVALKATGREPRVTEDMIMAKVVGTSFSLVPERDGTSMMCIIIMRNGWKHRGFSDMVSESGYDPEISQAQALRDALKEATKYEAYLLKEELYRQGLGRIAQSSVGIEHQKSS